MSDIQEDDFKVDRTAFTIGSIHDESDEKDYWKSVTAEERIKAIEIMRQIVYGYRGSTPRLQRFFEVAERKAS